MHVQQHVQACKHLGMSLTFAQLKILGAGPKHTLEHQKMPKDACTVHASRVTSDRRDIFLYMNWFVDHKYMKIEVKANVRAPYTVAIWSGQRAISGLCLAPTITVCRLCRLLICTLKIKAYKFKRKSIIIVVLSFA